MKTLYRRLTAFFRRLFRKPVERTLKETRKAHRYSSACSDEERSRSKAEREQPKTPVNPQPPRL